MTPTEIKEIIQKNFPDSVVENDELGDHQVELKGENWADIAKFLKENPSLYMDQLECISGVDLGEEKPLQSRYNLHSMEHRHKIEVVITLSKDNPSVPSIEQVWGIGDWFERETYDMYGIVYEGHRDLRRILLPEDWEGWPLRKNYETPESYHGIIVPKVKEEWE